MHNPQLVLFYAQNGKPLKARCSVCGTDTRRRRVVEEEENLIEIFCPTCDSRLLIVADMNELQRHLARGAQLIAPVKRRART
jgi:DNA-directed RNA polymerase subunit RPC12/RpoP